MLSDREQQTLDATAAHLAQDDPVLAARLTRHTLPALAGRRHRLGLPIAAWPPLLLAVFCLLLLVLPALLI